ncbi:MAG: hypothetical protein HQK88_15680 [Nitrospirae bacterium]|nr:hypothetical protein [Nitrospirota bacterium]MBF0518676.1 hypothetical protein [Nitrospirota bacterium]MBF0536301.1 hypothetical protein [Nitrospirota bacterium]MBF0618242.1 hypothetical protein [Nitrospirota bacterium]
MVEKKEPVVREILSTRVRPELIKKMKFLCVEENKRMNQLFEEAIELLLVEYKKKKGRLFD